MEKLEALKRIEREQKRIYGSDWVSITDQEWKALVNRVLQIWESSTEEEIIQGLIGYFVANFALTRSHYTDKRKSIELVENILLLWCCDYDKLVRLVDPSCHFLLVDSSREDTVHYRANAAVGNELPLLVESMNAAGHQCEEDESIQCSNQNILIKDGKREFSIARQITILLVKKKTDEVMTFMLANTGRLIKHGKSFVDRILERSKNNVTYPKRSKYDDSNIFDPNQRMISPICSCSDSCSGFLEGLPMILFNIICGNCVNIKIELTSSALTDGSSLNRVQCFYYNATVVDLSHYGYYLCLNQHHATYRGKRNTALNNIRSFYSAEILNEVERRTRPSASSSTQASLPQSSQAQSSTTVASTESRRATASNGASARSNSSSPSTPLNQEAVVSHTISSSSSDSTNSTLSTTSATSTWTNSMNSYPFLTPFYNSIVQKNSLLNHPVGILLLPSHSNLSDQALLCIRHLREIGDSAIIILLQYSENPSADLASILHESFPDDGYKPGIFQSGGALRSLFIDVVVASKLATELEEGEDTTWQNIQRFLLYKRFKIPGLDCLVRVTDDTKYLDSTSGLFEWARFQTSEVEDKDCQQYAHRMKEGSIEYEICDEMGMFYGKDRSTDERRITKEAAKLTYRRQRDEKENRKNRKNGMKEDSDKKRKTQEDAASAALDYFS